MAAVTTQTFETLLTANRGQPPSDGTPGDPKNISSDFFFKSTGVIDIEGGGWEDQRPALDLNTSFGDLDTLGSGYAWMNLAGFEEAIGAEYDAHGFNIWLITKQTTRVDFPLYDPTMTAVRTYLDVEVRPSEWSGEPPGLRAEITASGYDRNVMGFGDRQPVATDETALCTFELRGLTFEFDQTESSREFYKTQIYDPLWFALTANSVESLLWPSPPGGIFEIGWIRLRVEVDYGIVPYRRIFPRPDGLAGGAPRVYPRPATQQASNRIVGGIF